MFDQRNVGVQALGKSRHKAKNKAKELLRKNAEHSGCELVGRIDFSYFRDTRDGSWIVRASSNMRRKRT